MIYAVNNTTKEHRVISGDAREVDSWRNKMQGWRVVEADADGWIEWHGGECPLPNGNRCQYRMRDGDTSAEDAEALLWDHEGENYDISAYRPILEPQAPKWDGEGLPPVGWAGEYGPYFHACEVIAYHKGYAVVWDAYDLEYFRTKDPSIFRPIPTEEDRAVGEMADIMDGVMSSSYADMAEALYRAGYRKQPTEDMTDPANWRAGDVVESVTSGAEDLTQGKHYIINAMDCDNDPTIDDDLDEDATRYRGYFRFIRRP